jgi:hypothetical protein
MLSPLSVRGAELDGSLELRREYSDNIFLREKDKIADNRTIITPALSFAHEKNLNTLWFEYSSELIYHDDYPEQDTFSHHLNFLVESDPTNNISAAISISDTYRLFYVDPSWQDQPILAEELAEGNTFAIAPSLRFRVANNSRVFFKYQYSNTFYEDFPEGIDREGHRGTFTWKQNFKDKVTLGLSYIYFTQRFDQPLDQQPDGATEYNDHEGQVSLQWRISSKFSCGARYGYVWREYDTHRELNHPDWGANITFIPFEETELSASYSQTLEDDVFGSSYEVRQGGLELSQEIGERFSVTLGGFYQELEYQDTNEILEIWEGELGLRTAISSKLSLYLNGSYRDWTSEQTVEEQELSTASGTLTYQILDWLAFDIRYSYLENISNIPASEYTINRYSAAVTATF